MIPLHTQVEALLFCSPNPLSQKDIVSLLRENNSKNNNTPDIGKEVAEAVETLKRRYAPDDRAFGLCSVGGGYQFLTKPVLASVLSTFLKQHTRRRLSKACLETLSIIAYTQPTTRSDIEQLRGVNSDHAVQRLMEKELVHVRGRKTNTQALLYGTTKKFMNHFGINSLNDLPNLPDLPAIERAVP